ncbi:UDP-N-acetylmuramate dehydrogenase [Miniphocaeibacter halophilus]|uniref:UDP-N-acetylmuramate dehydrogenase n=1 Tax=Miniphocaeibacter halophilus TaxID=2931922 RepID=A0AC61MU84_9FIRM|nr:UDP-N-acetylmuramate dehydrogenase [Miniphocaeibacter halophilus]QQK07906.1 UDP-N-acetylmuramate dehydrogenase [Miniphocaeibacter halophilus]
MTIDYKEIFSQNNVGKVLYNEPMANHTTFKIGGPCDVMILPKEENEIINALNIIKKNNLEYMIIGNGSNLLVRDKGIRKVIIKLNDNYSNIEIKDNYVIAQAGALLSKTAKTAMKEDLTGMEFASGIPGGIGGAITMNAGAYGGEMKDILYKVKALNRDLEIVEYNLDEMNMRYRNSRVQDEGLIVLEATFKLKKGNPEEIKALYDDLTFKRTSKQPLEYASAGSTFKRPEGHFAGKLIDDCGLRGYRYKDAQVSEKHCGFVINRGNADFEQVYHVISHVQEVVKEKFGVNLEPEIRIIGEE